MLAYRAVAPDSGPGPEVLGDRTGKVVGELSA